MYCLLLQVTEKDEVKREVTVSENQPEENTDGKVVEPNAGQSRCGEDSQTDCTVTSENNLTVDFVQSAKSFPESAEEKVPNVIKNTEIEENIAVIPETNVVRKDCKDEQMEVAEVSKNEAKNENLNDELVMVDMMTDVGVVEEVLESEGKQPLDESMQVELGNENNVENECEVSSS